MVMIWAGNMLIMAGKQNSLIDKVYLSKTTIVRVPFSRFTFTLYDIAY